MKRSISPGVRIPQAALDAGVAAILEHARWAPSIHNSQPWSWRLRGNELELSADRSRQLVVTDPVGRNLVISCGAALQYAMTSASALGWETSTRIVPDGRDAEVLARIRLTPGQRPPDSLTILEALRNRCTDRRRFTNWPVPQHRLRRLAEAARVAGVDVHVVTDPVLRWHAELLIDSARRAQERDVRVLDEEHRWVDRGSNDGMVSTGVSADVDGDRSSNLRRRETRFDHGRRAEVPAKGGLEDADGLLVIGTGTDDAAAWLRSGLALTRIWLRATDEGLSLVPLSQAVEVSDSRTHLTHEVLPGGVLPQILVRIGWQEIGRSGLPRTARRPVAEILRS